MSLFAGTKFALAFKIPQTELLAGTSIELVSPCDGYITELQTIVQTAVTTGGAITVLTGDAGATTVLGLSVTIPDAAAKGSRVADLATAGSSTRAITKGARIQIVPAAAFATAGAVDGNLIINSADTSPAL